MSPLHLEITDTLYCFNDHPLTLFNTLPYMWVLKDCCNTLNTHETIKVGFVFFLILVTHTFLYFFFFGNNAQKKSRYITIVIVLKLALQHPTSHVDKVVILRSDQNLPFKKKYIIKTIIGLRTVKLHFFQDHKERILRPNFIQIHYILFNFASKRIMSWFLYKNQYSFY